MGRQLRPCIPHIAFAGLLVARVASPSAPAATARTELVGGRAVLENGHCRLELDSRTGEIVALTPAPASLKSPWFEVVEEKREGMASWETWRHGEESVFAGGPATLTCGLVGDAARATMTWERPSGLRITGEALLRPEDAGLRFRLQVSNRGGLTLVDTLRLPVLRGIELGDPAHDWFTWPHTIGARFRAQGFQPGERLEQPYPEFLYMQWLDLHDDRQGFYVGCLDDYGYCKNLFIGREADGRNVMGVTFTGCWIAKPGDAWTTPWVQIAAHQGN